MKDWLIGALAVCVIGLLFLAFVCPPCPPPRPESTEAHADQRHPEQDALYPTGPVRSFGSSQAKNQTAQIQNKTQGINLMCGWTDFFNFLIALATVALAVIGGYGVKYALRTLKAIEKQTTHASAAADAAKASADALIASERAWVIIELVPQAVKAADKHWYRKVGNQWVCMTDDEMWAGEYLKYKLKFTNAGKTPAHILSFEITVGERTDIRDSAFWIVAGESKEIEDPVADINRALAELIFEVGDALKARNVPVEGLVRYQHIFSQREIVETNECHYVYSTTAEKMLILPRDKQSEDKEKEQTT